MKASISILTLENIKSEYTFIQALFGGSECYHNTVNFSGHGNFCDVYFVSLNSSIKQEQVNVYNQFQENFRKHIPQIEQELRKSFNRYEIGREYEIKNSILLFEVIQIPQSNLKYDLVLVCSKEYKKFIFFKRSITLRVEFKNGEISSLKRTSDSTKDNTE